MTIVNGRYDAEPDMNDEKVEGEEPHDWDRRYDSESDEDTMPTPQDLWTRALSNRADLSSGLLGFG